MRLDTNQRSDNKPKTKLVKTVTIEDKMAGHITKSGNDSFSEGLL